VQAIISAAADCRSNVAEILDFLAGPVDADWARNSAPIGCKGLRPAIADESRHLSKLVGGMAHIKTCSEMVAADSRGLLPPWFATPFAGRCAGAGTWALLIWLICGVAAWQPRPVHGQEPASPELSAPRRGGGLTLPKNLPGAQAPPIQLPAYDPQHPEQRMEAVDRLFPPLPPLPPAIYPVPGPEERPVRLAELENMALSTSPLIRQAMADITATRGNAIQMGTHPNPTVGYEGDTIGSGGSPDYHGGYFNQWIKTAGKLQLAQAVAMMDVRNAELTLRKTRIMLITTVQARYYAVLVAEEAVRVNEALVRFTEDAYRIQVEQLRGGEAAAYEPMQLRVLALQARAALIQARNRYFSAWKQLAAAVNNPDLAPTQLAGNLNLSVPIFEFDPLKTIVWERHPDILAARNTLQQARINLRLQEVTPIPDLYVYCALQKDYTFFSNGASINTQVGMPIPFFDRNVGGILQAQGQLGRAVQLGTRVRNDLTTTLADSFERYMNNRAILEYYRSQILPDQATAYRGTYDRHQQQPDRVGFADVVVAQQTYANAIANYIASLGAQWTAVTDLLNTVQVEDLIDLQQVVKNPTLLEMPEEIPDAADPRKVRPGEVEPHDAPPVRPAQPVQPQTSR
jgi:outer membrane protein, heavy metal efflux system